MYVTWARLGQGNKEVAFLHNYLLDYFKREVSFAKADPAVQVPDVSLHILVWI